jgi:hypothetical protein
MKSFNLFLDNISGLPPELVMALWNKKVWRIGIGYHKESFMDRLGHLNIFTIWLWRWHWEINWISGEK